MAVCDYERGMRGRVEHRRSSASRLLAKRVWIGIDSSAHAARLFDPSHEHLSPLTLPHTSVDSTDLSLTSAFKPIFTLLLLLIIIVSPPAPKQGHVFLSATVTKACAEEQ